MRTRSWMAGPACALVVLICAISSADAGNVKATYPSMAPIAQYWVTTPADEAALARSAAPPSIAGEAGVLVLGTHGYQTVAKGTNGFVCLVERSWAASFSDPDFWNPHLRGPICFNPAAVRSVLPAYLERTEWVLTGVSRTDMIARTKAELAANTFVMPEPGAMSYMLSKHGYLSDAGGHWHPHLMFFVAHTDGAAWGANLDGSPVYALQGDPEPVTTFIVPVTNWSDGTPLAMEML